MLDYHPKGPLPLYLADFNRDTLGWPKSLKWEYLQLLDHLWSQGGSIADDDNEIVNAAGIVRAKGYKDRVAKLRSKLVPATDLWRTYGHSYALSIGIASPKVCFDLSQRLAQKRVMEDLLKALNLREKRSVTGSKGGRPKKTNSFSQQEILLFTPSPSPVKEEPTFPTVVPPDQNPEHHRARGARVTHEGGDEIFATPKSNGQGRGRAERGSRLEPDWAPRDGGEFAYRHGFTSEQAQFMLDEFRDYWVGVPGQKGCKLDWDRTWQNRVRFKLEQERRQTQRRPAPRTLV